MKIYKIHKLWLLELELFFVVTDIKNLFTFKLRYEFNIITSLPISHERKNKQEHKFMSHITSKQWTGDGDKAQTMGKINI